MLTVIAKIKVQSGKEAEFERACREMVSYVRSEEPDTLSYVLHRARKEPGTFLFYERYRDRAALDTHAQSAQMANLVSIIGPLFDGPPVIETYEEIDGKR